MIEPLIKISTKEREQAEFEYMRLRLLIDQERGGLYWPEDKGAIIAISIALAILGLMILTVIWDLVLR